MKPVIYLDNNATTAVAPEVLEAMLPYFTESYGNPSSMHRFGGKNGAAVEQARESLASLLGAKFPEEVFFTSCGTESNATALHAALSARPDKKHIITTRVEHPAIYAAAQHLEKNGYRVTFLKVDSKGQLSLADLERAITNDTALVSTMYANNETGVVFPIQEIGEICRERNVLFHTDAVQAVGKIPLNLEKAPIDYLSLSGHKLHAPKGVGALYVRRGAPFRPFLRGGHQEFGRRAGTEPVPHIVGLGKASELAKEHFEYENTVVKDLRDRLEKELLERIPLSMVNGSTIHRLPNTTNISFKYIEGEAILLLLDEHGICASSGSACTSGSLEPSHVLRALGVPFTYAHGSIRFSLSRYTSKADIDTTIQLMPGIVKRLREMSPYAQNAEDL